MSALVTTLPLAASTRSVNWDTFIPDKLVPAIFDTLYMVSVTMVIAGLLGLIMGALLYTTRTGNIFQNRFAYTVLNVLVNIVRPIPFIILIAALGPLTSAVVQTRLGINAAIFAMTFGASFAIARIVEQNMVSIDPGVIEAARAMGASKLRILFTVMIPESLGPLILGYTFIVIGVVDMSPWPGTWAVAAWVRSLSWTATRGSRTRSPGLWLRSLSCWCSSCSLSAICWRRRLCAARTRRIRHTQGVSREAIVFRGKPLELCLGL